jgi:uncharacterized protein YqhQ
MKDGNCGKSEFQYGGQAVIEGVMMRGAKHFAVAVRRINGEIASSQEPIQGGLLKLKWLNKPFLRGMLAIVDSMSLGIKTLMYSANIRIDDEEAAERARKEAESPVGGPGAAPSVEEKPSKVNDVIITLTPVLAILLSFGLFFFIPAWFGMFIKAHVTTHRLWLGLAEGGFKFFLLLSYVSAISFMKDIRRVFQYHGAEHKTINAYEAGEELTVENVQKYTTVHVRCGTSFLLVVVMTSIVVFAFVPWNSLLERFLYKIVLIPVVAGIAYEVIRFAGRHKDSPLMRLVLAPGLLMQRITTKEPADDMVEVAIASLKGVFDQEKAAADTAAAEA